MFKSSSSLTNDFTRDYSVVDQDLSGCVIGENVLAGLEIVAERTAFAVRMPPNLKPKLFEVILGPVDLGPSTFHVRVRHENDLNV